MALQPLAHPPTYVPMTEDKHLRNSIERIISKDSGIPIKIANEYPQRGDDIYNQIRVNVARNKREEYRVVSPLKEQKIMGDMLVVLCYWGTNKTRQEVTQRALLYLTEMNPMPQVVFVEGSVDGNYHFQYVTQYGFSYIPVDLRADCYRNLFVKEILWNYGVKRVLENNFAIKKLCYLDSDCAFVDRYSFSEISKTLDQYDVISPMKAAYYADTDKLSGKYGLLHTVGYQYTHKTTRSGWQGFGLACTVSFLKQYFNLELPCSSLGFADCLFWWFLTCRVNMKNFRNIPYDPKKLQQYVLPPTVKIGFANTIIMHLYHGNLTDRQYQVKCRLVRLCIKEPFSDLARLDNELIGWNNNPETGKLRHCLENLLIYNRLDMQITTEEEANQFYNWVMGLCPRPPKKIRPTRFAPNGNRLPASEVSWPVPNKISEI